MINLDTGLWQRGQLASFNPLSLSPALWLDASDSTTLYTDSGLTTRVAADGDPVGGWKDKSGNLKHATQASGTNKPSYKINIKNSNSIVRFDGVNDSLVFASTLSYFNFLHATQGDVFCVFQANPLIANPNAIYPIIDSRNLNSGDNGFTFFYDDRSSVSRNDAVFASGGTPSPNNFSILTSNNMVAPGTWCSLSLQLNGQNATASNRAKIYINNVLNSITNTETGTNTANATNNMSIGQGQNSYFLNGNIAEILIFTTNLSVSNRNAVESYLNSKWAIY